ncbi:MAG: sulfite reductase, beta subunit (hemoprotein) [Planctomycetes bacterium]|nr:sulfite reductase, beta subunit (hemoprotein) [Planctomycetota bacterium]
MTNEPILNIPITVTEDVSKFRSEVQKFLDGDTTPIAFRAYRVPMGIYEQREEGKYMVRIRIGAGLVKPYQLQRISQLSKKYGNGILHVTTRQDIQIHEVAIENTADVLESLLEVGLSARGGGGNTVRNVSACPRAGVCPNEKFDVSPHAVAVAEYLLQARSSFRLPRKFKIAFSGCSNDCALASVTDLGFFAHIKDGQKGFAVYAAGGLGSNPAIAIKLEDFIVEEKIFEMAETLKQVFDAHGDRSNKHKARLRYVVARLGKEKFIQIYKDIRAQISKDGLKGDIPQIRDMGTASPSTDTPTTDTETLNITGEKDGEHVTVKLRLHLGDITADNLAEVAQIAEKYSTSPVRTTQNQDILITTVLNKDADKITADLKTLTDDVIGRGPKLVACTGAATCKLGLCLSRSLADAISEKLAETATADDHRSTTIRISGCPNSCGQHNIAPIGFQGRAKRVNGKLMPCYDVLVGGKTEEANATLAKNVGTVPAKKIPKLIVSILTDENRSQSRITELVKRCGDFTLDEYPEDFYKDFGSDEPFSLAGRGPGECGAGVTDVIKFDIQQAKDLLKKAAAASKEPEKSDTLYNAILSASRALLIVFGAQPKKDRQVFDLFKEHLIIPGWLTAKTADLLEDALDWRLGDKETLTDLFPQIENTVSRIEELFLSLDANLKFRAKPAEEKQATDVAETKPTTSDLRGVQCPLNFVKAKIALEMIDIGQTLEVLLDAGEPARNVPASFADQGQEVIKVEQVQDHYAVYVKRIK